MGMDKKIEKKTWTLRRILFIVLGVGVVGLLISAVLRETGTSKLNVNAERILTDTIHTGVFKEFISIFGIVEPAKTVYLDAIESGRVEEIYVEDGAMLERGTPILRLSNSNLQLSVLNQEAQIINQINTIRNQSILMEQQSLNLKEQALNVDFQIDLFSKRTQRNSGLYAEKAISQVDFEETQDEYEHLLRRRKLLAATIQQDSLYHVLQQNQMENSLDLMRRNLDFAKNNLDNLVVKAPISGQLSSMDSEIGELITQGTRIAQMDVLSEYKIQSQIDEFYISRIFPQQEGSFEMDGKTYRLVIKKIYPEVNDGRFTVDLLFVGDRPSNIKRGQNISFKLSLSDETNAQLLAKGGFFKDTGGNWVYVINPKDNVARKKDIQLGRQNPNYYEVTQGLEDGDVVIISSYSNFGDKDELVLR